MGACVSKVIQTKSNHSVVPHEGVRAYHAEPKPLVGKITDDVADCSGIYSRVYKTAEEVKSYQTSCYTGLPLPARLKKTCGEFAERNAIGVRPVDRIEKTTVEHNGKQKNWEYVHYKPTVTHTFKSLYEMVEGFGRGLIEIGLPRGVTVGLYEDTRMEWLVSCYGIWSAGGIGVTVYANLGEDALVYAMKEAELSYMFCNGKLVKNLIKLCTQAGIKIPTLIYTDDLPADLDLKGATAYSFSAIVEKGKASTAELIEDHKPDDLALVMYTSGTTGDPKGVMLSHGNLSAAIDLFSRRLRLFGMVGRQVTYMAYLPLAHILEFAVENLFLIEGSFIGYGTPRTLTDATAKPHGDLVEFRPHVLIGVPRVFETIRKGVEAAIPAAGMKRRIFDDARANRLGHLANGNDTPYLNEKVFSAIKSKLGGRCEVILSGGAPLSAEVLKFLTAVTGASCIQGYGLTETCACITTQLPWDISTDTSGCLIEGVEVKLRDAEEWKHTDACPRGEILVRSPALMKGYYKQPEMTKSSISEDGWFATGDVGEINADGNLNIVGRVKALVKNAFGEYVALDSLEAVYCLSPLALPNGVCVLVNGQKAFICALVVTDETKAMAFAREHGIEGSWPEILKNKAFQDKATATFAEIAKKNKRKSFEIVKKVVVLSDEWTPENGILTAAQKLKRREIDKRYASLIEELFATEPDS